MYNAKLGSFNKPTEILSFLTTYMGVPSEWTAEKTFYQCS